MSLTTRPKALPAQDAVQLARDTVVPTLCPESALNHFPAGVVSLTGQILRLEPANVPALLLRGHAYLHLGDIPVAVRHFSEALRSDPDHREAMALFRSLKQLQRKREKVCRSTSIAFIHA